MKNKLLIFILLTLCSCEASVETVAKTEPKIKTEADFKQQEFNYCFDQWGKNFDSCLHYMGRNKFDSARYFLAKERAYVEMEAHFNK